MRMRVWMVLFCLFSLCSCQSAYKKPPINPASDDASIKLAEAASSISDSMYQMARVEKVITPPHKDNTMTIPNTPALQTRASVDWAGPVEELVQRIGSAAHYRVRVLGRSPSIPVLVSVTTEDKTLAEILRDMDYQAGKNADIRVYPQLQVVELRYAKTYS